MNYLFQIELGIVAEPGRFIRSKISIPEYGKLPTIQGGGAPAVAIADVYREMWGVVIENGEKQGGSRLGMWIDLIREMTPDYVTCRGF